MKNRDIDVEIQKREKKVLTDKIAEQSREIERLQARINEFLAKLHE